MTPTQEILAQYRKTETFTDDKGRVYKMRVLKPSEVLKVLRLADSEHNTIIMNYLIAASICEMQGLGEDGENLQVAFPKNAGQLDGILNNLGRVGMRAATLKYLEMNKTEEEEPTPEDDDVADAA